MKKIYYTAIPLDSNFKLEPKPFNPSNFKMNSAIKFSRYPIIPVIAATADPGSAIKVVTIRQKNAEKSDNYDKFLEEIASLDLPNVEIADCSVPESQESNVVLKLFSKIIEAAEEDSEYYACMTFGTKIYPVALFSALAYIDKVISNTEINGIYYREILRDGGDIIGANTYDMRTLFEINQIIDTVSRMHIDSKEFLLQQLIDMGM